MFAVFGNLDPVVTLKVAYFAAVAGMELELGVVVAVVVVAEIAA